MKSLVYIETTIPCFYYEARQEPEMAARRNWTRKWWKSYRHRFRLATSEAVLTELGVGEYDSRDEAIALVAGLDLLDIPDEVADIIDIYLDSRLMPRDRLGDALHLALASYHKCDFLLTWDCQHIAGLVKRESVLTSRP